MSGAVVVVAAVGLVAAGAVGAALALPQPVPGPVVGSGGAASVDVVTQSYDGGRSAQATPEWAPLRELSTRAVGTVTGTHCVPAADLAAGSPVVEVDGRRIVLLATEVPLWRDLAPGIDGDDVRALQAEFARQGFKVEVTGRYGTATQVAVRSLLGVGPKDPGALPLDQVVWTPDPVITPSKCPLAVGDSVEPGATVVSVGGGLASLRLVNPPEGDGWVAEHGELTAPVDDEGVITDPAFLAAMQDTPEVMFARDEGGGQVEVTVRLAEAIEVVVVPPSAVAVVDDGHGCVATDAGTLPVRIVGSALGQTMVQFDSAPRSVTVRFPDDAGSGRARC